MPTCIPVLPHDVLRHRGRLLQRQEKSVQRQQQRTRASRPGALAAPAGGSGSPLLQRRGGGQPSRIRQGLLTAGQQLLLPPALAQAGRAGQAREAQQGLRGTPLPPALATRHSLPPALRARQWRAHRPGQLAGTGFAVAFIVAAFHLSSCGVDLAAAGFALLHAQKIPGH
jgi:hypothetical protein